METLKALLICCLSCLPLLDFKIDAIQLYVYFKFYNFSLEKKKASTRKTCQVLIKLSIFEYQEKLPFNR